jgi:hypothetical protein
MRILIALATWNRPVITEICLENLSAARSADVRLVVYDDASDAYDKAWLSGYADEVVRFASTGGISRSRAKAMRDFVYRFTDFDLLYLTDNDTLHDPRFVEVIRWVFETRKGAGKPLPLSLFNSVFHSAPENVLGEHPQLLLVKTIPGASRVYERTMAEQVVQVLNTDPELEHVPGWDWHYMTLLARPSLLTRTSYMEHFARDRLEGGMHNPSSGLGDAGRADFERDRALNPTPWLAERREEVIRRLLY